MWQAVGLMKETSRLGSPPPAAGPFPESSLENGTPAHTRSHEPHEIALSGPWGSAANLLSVWVLTGLIKSNLSCKWVK